MEESGGSIFYLGFFGWRNKIIMVGRSRVYVILIRF